MVTIQDSFTLRSYNYSTGKKGLKIVSKPRFEAHHCKKSLDLSLCSSKQATKKTLAYGILRRVNFSCAETIDLWKSLILLFTRLTMTYTLDERRVLCESKRTSNRWFVTTQWMILCNSVLSECLVAMVIETWLIWSVSVACAITCRWGLGRCCWTVCGRRGSERVCLKRKQQWN